jgi:uncharacterized Tic20 family protein
MPHLPNYDYSPYNNPSGTRASVPKEIKGWNWGAFLICFFWSIGNNVWIGLLSATPFVGLFVAIYMGINGNELAWKNKRWESVEHFKSTQKNWTIAGVIFTIISFFLGWLGFVTMIYRGFIHGICHFIQHYTSHQFDQFNLFLLCSSL